MRKAIVLTALCLLITNGIAKDLGWLVKPEKGGSGYPESGFIYQWSVTPVLCHSGWEPDKEENTTPSGWNRLGIYGAEFGLAAVGSGLCAALAYGFYSSWKDYAEFNGPGFVGFVGGALIYSITSPFLSAAGTHFAGKLLGQKGKFSHALLGAAVGDVLGLGAAIGYEFATLRKGDLETTDKVALGIWAVFPPIGSVVGYNVGMGGNYGEW